METKLQAAYKHADDLNRKWGEALAELDRLQAENAELREALEGLRKGKHIGGTIGACHIEHTHAAWEKARAALAKGA